MRTQTTTPKASAASKSATPKTTAVHLPTNLVRALDESMAVLGVYQDTAEFLCDLTADMFTDNSGFLESFADDADYQVARKLARIRKKYGFTATAEACR